MCKAYIISDIHLGVHHLHPDKWVTITKEYFFNWFIPILKDKVRPGDQLYILGDVFHDRTTIYIPALLLAQEILEALAKILPVHVMIGNHDMYSVVDPYQNSLRWIKYIKDVHFYETPKVIQQDGQKIYMLPWIQDRNRQMSLLMENKDCDYVFCHSELQGAYDNERKHIDTLVRLNSFKYFKHVFSGHIHIRQSYGNFTYVGAPYHMDRHDKGDKKAVHVLDFKTGNIDIIENDFSPEYKTLEIATEEDLVKLKDNNVNHDMVDLVLNSNLLFESKKTRKTLLHLMEDHAFEKVQMLEPVKTDSTKKEIQLDTTTFNWNIDDITVNFIKSDESIDTETKVELINLFGEVIVHHKNNAFNLK